MMSNDRGVTLGGGPFQPPNPSDLATLRSQAEQQEATIARLTNRLGEHNARLRVETPNDLSELLSYVLDAGDVSVDTDLDGELVVNVRDLTIRDGEIVPARREFQVSALVFIEVNATVEAGDEDEARDLFESALESMADDVDLDLEPYDGIESSYSTHPSHGSISAYEA